MLLPSLISTALLASGVLVDNVSAMGRFAERVRNPYQINKRALPAPPILEEREASKSSFRFLNNKTKSYAVDSLPEVTFDIGEIYSGLIPIDAKNESRALFFIFQPTINEPVDEITIWLNGGPGCSSLEGFFQENGRFTWQSGTFAPVENPYSWVNLTNMLWVDQPVGTGFAIGTPTATSQEDIAADFVKFFKNFEDVFGIKKFKIYITGESYAGRYVPYISAAFLDQNNTDYFDLKGALVYDPCIGQYDYVQQEAPTVPFIQQNNNLFNFNASFLAELENLHKTCGYEDFVSQYLTFPASGVQPPKSFDTTANASCDVFDIAINAAYDPNPCFNLYAINWNCPIPWDVLGFPTSFQITPPGSTIYFDRDDVKKALHAPNLTWSECSHENVFVGTGGPEGEGDLAANPIEHVLPQVIEATNRVLVGNGDYDMIIITNGTLLAIQNMTWNGKLGFEQQPSTPINIQIPDLIYTDTFNAQSAAGEDGPQGEMGVQHFERGLMWAETFQSGHMQPQFQPRVAYRHLEWLLGRTEEI